MFAGMVAMVAVVTSPTTAGCSVMYCNCSCSCSVVELQLWCNVISVGVVAARMVVAVVVL